MWETRCSELSESSNNETCNHADSCLDEILFEIQNSEASALSACCAFGGGFRTGKSILMEDQSPIRCRVLNSSSDIIVCECSDETQRYDTLTSSCISSCTPGERWESVISDPYDSINSDAGRCVPCLAGTYSLGSVDGWVETCSDCGAGEYVAKNGSSACLECIAGEYTSSEGKSKCDVCTAGKYSEFSKGSSMCETCTEGTYADSNGTSACSLCDAGKYTFEEGNLECDVCPKGTYSELKKGSSTCLNCTEGTYTSSDEQSTCSQCVAGKYTSTQGNSECKVCLEGMYSELTRGSTKCLECSPGTFSSGGSSTCSSCPRGRFTTHNASAECYICLSGHHTDGLEEGSSVCTQCLSGTSSLPIFV